ncbi:MAG: YdcH family protein [Sphingopyxis sp.]|uniref:YdcH family protein n=1 Tax=Sphingopyxis sp. TaxID=1908224 RepID=UPI002AB9E6D2|nr:YdcH family protein [Sphingopyxis sp.]MDZ3833418.1 YdcH family protein [Sphingopyxis sp.]
MSTSHLSALKSRHADLDAKIANEERRPAPDMALLAQLKKQKLRLKEEMLTAA